MRFPKIVAAFAVAALVVFASVSLFGGQDAKSANPMDGINPRDMILEEVSPYGLDETVKRLTDTAKAEGWVVGAVRPMHKSVKKNGGPDVLPVMLVELCSPQDAGALLLDDASRYSSVMMPCTISVYEKTDGKVYVAHVNAKMIGMLFGGKVGEVMGGPVAAAQEKFLNAVR